MYKRQEYTLPDYCADIQKILKCIVTPEVTSVSAAGDSLTIDGCASMHVLYLDAKGGCVRGFDTKKEFTCSVRLRAQAENVTAEAEPFVQHMTCRAMNARRVDLHITLGLSVRAYAVRQLEIADCISDDRVETKCEEYDVTRAVGCVMHAFILEQNAELPNGKSPIELSLIHICYGDDRALLRLFALVRGNGKHGVFVLVALVVIFCRDHKACGLQLLFRGAVLVADDVRNHGAFRRRAGADVDCDRSAGRNGRACRRVSLDDCLLYTSRCV